MEEAMQKAEERSTFNLPEASFGDNATSDCVRIIFHVLASPEIEPYLSNAGHKIGVFFGPPLGNRDAINAVMDIRGRSPMKNRPYLRGEMRLAREFLGRDIPYYYAVVDVNEGKIVAHECIHASEENRKLGLPQRCLFVSSDVLREFDKFDDEICGNFDWTSIDRAQIALNMLLATIDPEAISRDLKECLSKARNIVDIYTYNLGAALLMIDKEGNKTKRVPIVTEDEPLKETMRIYSNQVLGAQLKDKAINDADKFQIAAFTLLFFNNKDDFEQITFVRIFATLLKSAPDLLRNPRILGQFENERLDRILVQCMTKFIATMTTREGWAKITAENAASWLYAIPVLILLSKKDGKFPSLPGTEWRALELKSAEYATAFIKAVILLSGLFQHLPTLPDILLSLMSQTTFAVLMKGYSEQLGSFKWVNLFDKMYSNMKTGDNMTNALKKAFTKMAETQLKTRNPETGKEVLDYFSELVRKDAKKMRSEHFFFLKITSEINAEGNEKLQSEAFDDIVESCTFPKWRTGWKRSLDNEWKYWSRLASLASKLLLKDGPYKRVMNEFNRFLSYEGVNECIDVYLKYSDEMESGITDELVTHIIQHVDKVLTKKNGFFNSIGRFLGTYVIHNNPVITNPDKPNSGLR